MVEKLQDNWLSSARTMKDHLTQWSVLIWTFQQKKRLPKCQLLNLLTQLNNTVCQCVETFSARAVWHFFLYFSQKMHGLISSLCINYGDKCFYCLEQKPNAVIKDVKKCSFSAELWFDLVLNTSKTYKRSYCMYITHNMFLHTKVKHIG